MDGFNALDMTVGSQVWRVQALAGNLRRRRCNLDWALTEDDISISGLLRYHVGVVEVSNDDLDIAVS